MPQRPVLDHLADELAAQAPPSIRREDVDVGEVHDGRPVRERTREADLPRAVIQPDNPRRVADQTTHDVMRPPLSPVRMVGEKIVDGVDVDSVDVVVEDEVLGEGALHRRILAGPTARAARRRSYLRSGLADRYAPAPRAGRGFPQVAPADAAGTESAQTRHDFAGIVDCQRVAGGGPHPGGDARA